ncbi:hypothetical protein BKP35_12720 [Anaerobacillus arseniciselenatis]|uniref:YtpI-like protein n=1 Tax=Anaerobacillus arseniciselenatis TaxID=85682 RepID=A0A1S2LHH5_9BACI|nr:YtpI family protein [Anaerobacillus arseniciselenatis]OIJ10945.1 hypothetical protein BKP35_12720 [Anaerobacillus arseniciselenatis]
MLITTSIIIISVVFYIFFKVKYFRTKAPIEKKWISTKGNIAIGVFLVAFGLNQLRFPTNVSVAVGFTFIFLGGANIYFGYKAYKYYLPLAIEEAKA